MITVLDLHQNDPLSHLSQTVLGEEWTPASAQEPAWSAAPTTSEADSQTCTWSSVHQPFWTAGHERANLSKSYLRGGGGGGGCKTGTIGYCSKSEISVMCNLSFPLCVWSYWHIVGRRAEETHEQSAWWRRKGSFPVDRNTDRSWFTSITDTHLFNK